MRKHLLILMGAAIGLLPVIARADAHDDRCMNDLSAIEFWKQMAVNSMLTHNGVVVPDVANALSNAIVKYNDVDHCTPTTIPPTCADYGRTGTWPNCHDIPHDNNTPTPTPTNSTPTPTPTPTPTNDTPTPTPTATPTNDTPTPTPTATPTNSTPTPTPTPTHPVTDTPTPTPTPTPRCDDNQGRKVDVCHREGNGRSHTISVNENAVSAHLGHGDTLGACSAGGDDDEETVKETCRRNLKCGAWNKKQAADYYYQYKKKHGR